ncbi:uncharacterized protein LOC110377805 isoform X1 [Helicoverpa armigera]|uniref:uncharacterized protein LOC110377805 isoform X1 n=2 Tax=Helicoverpa armigera TaxID=29058 RepID=UPI0030831E9D
MAEWSLPDLDCPINRFDSYHYATYPSYRQREPVPRVSYCPPQAQPSQPAASSATMAMHFAPQMHYASAPAPVPRGENPREMRNRAEKMRRDRLNQSVAELASMVPPVVAARRKIDKTTVLRLTAHYLRAHQYVFGDSIGQSPQEFKPDSMLKVLSMFNGFLITTTYRGIIVVASQNVHQYLGYTELDLLGQNLLNITHEDDRAMLREQLMPKSQTLGPNGELMIMDEPDAIRKAEEALAQEKRQFIIRLKKLGQRSEPNQYITCHVEGSLRKSDRACRGYNRCCQIVRRARARSENPCSSGNDIVFIGVVRPTSETFINESALESYRMEYRTRHSIDGEIIQCEARIALVTGYMTHEVSGVNAMNFMHRDDVRWVIIALREMYDQHRLFGESCYRLIAKNGQSIYMRTRGCLEVDKETRAVTSFVCTNTVVNEEEGKQLIKLMKQKFAMMVISKEDVAPAEKPANNEIAPPPVNENVEELQDEEEEEEEDEDEDDEDDSDEEDQTDEDQDALVEDPRRLEEVILHLVTNLPSPSSNDSDDDGCSGASSEKSMSPHRLTIIPPNRERIVSAIEKIYSVVKYFQKGSRRRQNVTFENRTRHGNGVRKRKQNKSNRNKRSNRIKTANINVPVVSSMPVAQPAPAAQNVTSTIQEIPTAQPMNDSGKSMVNHVSPTDYVNYGASTSSFSNLEFMYPNNNKSGEDYLNEQLNCTDDNETPNPYPDVDILLEEFLKEQCNSTDENAYCATELAMSATMAGFEEAASALPMMPQPASSCVERGTKRPASNDFEDFGPVFKKTRTEEQLVREHEPTEDGSIPEDISIPEDGSITDDGSILEDGSTPEDALATLDHLLSLINLEEINALIASLTPDEFPDLEPDEVEDFLSHLDTLRRMQRILENPGEE